MADNPNAAASGMLTTFTCAWCGALVNPIVQQQHVCDLTAFQAHRSRHLPASPVAPDVRLLALQEQIAKALERIADALEGLKKEAVLEPKAMCGEVLTTGNGLKFLCLEPAGHVGAHSVLR